MRIALIGAGRIGRLHGRVLAQLPGVDEVVISDIDEGAARRLAGEIGGAVAETAETALDAADAAVVAAPTEAHATLVDLALDRGLPTMCEKPLAADLAETAAIVERVERTGATLQVGFQRRFDAGYVEARRLVASGELGTVYLVRLIAHDNEPPPEAYIAGSGGLFRDSSIHDFDALRWLTGVEVDEVYATGSVRGFPVFGRYDDIDTGAVILRMTDGTLGILGQTRHDPLGYDVRMEVVGSKDAVAVGLGARTPLRSVEVDGPAMPGPAWDTFLTRFEDAYRAELVAFLRVARGEIASPCTARDGLEAVRISIAAGRSRTEHRPVRVEEIG